MTARAWSVVAAVLAAWLPAAAQSSPNYVLREHTLNAGGRPAQAVVAGSASFRVTLDSIGGPVVARAISGASFRMSAGFDAAYAPPGEVMGVEFLADRQTLRWLNEANSTAYDVYASRLSTLPGAFGGCAQSRVAGNSWSDPATPPLGDGLFYLVTGLNRLDEEGTKGQTSGGTERSNSSPCP
jgi:hypothetical protein